MDYKRIFVNLTHGAIGDTLYAFPLLEALRAACPESEIHVATWFYIQGILELAPEASVTPMVIKELRTEITYRISQQPPFDLAIDLNYDRLSLIETVATAAPVRVGSAETDGPDWWLTHRVPLDNSRHKLEEILDMGEAAGIDRPDGPFRVAAPQETEWSRKVGERCAGLKKRGLVLVGIHPGAKYESRMWPMERFLELSRRLIAERRAVIFLFGASYRQAPGNILIPDAERIDRIKAGLGDLEPMAVDARGIVPAGDFSALAALLGMLDLYIGNDTGPTHLAALVGCPVVDIMGAGYVHRWRPMGDKAIVIDRPAGEGGPGEEGAGEKRKLETIEVDEVLAAAAELLGR